MLNSNQRHSGGGGFTLIELMVTIALIVIALAFAAPSFTAFQRNAALSTLSNSLVASINTARGEAMKRGRNAFVVPKDINSWQGGWVAFVDQNRSNAYDSDIDYTLLVGETPESFVTVTPVNDTATATPPYLMFNAQGYTTKKDGSFTSVVFCFDLTGGTCNLTNADTRILIVSATGRPRLCRPASESNCTTSSKS